MSVCSQASNCLPLSARPAWGQPAVHCGFISRNDIYASEFRFDEAVKYLVEIFVVSYAFGSARMEIADVVNYFPPKLDRSI